MACRPCQGSCPVRHSHRTTPAASKWKVSRARTAGWWLPAAAGASAHAPAGHEAALAGTAHALMRSTRSAWQGITLLKPGEPAHHNCTRQRARRSPRCAAPLGSSTLQQGVAGGREGRRWVARVASNRVVLRSNMGDAERSLPQVRPRWCCEGSPGVPAPVPDTSVLERTRLSPKSARARKHHGVKAPGMRQLPWLLRCAPRHHYHTHPHPFFTTRALAHTARLLCGPSPAILTCHRSLTRMLGDLRSRCSSAGVRPCR